MQRPKSGRDDEPTIKPARPAPKVDPRMIEIPAGKKGTARPATPPHDPYKYWDDYFKAHDESPAELHELLDLLHAEKKFADTEGALRGYLTRRTSKAMPWMYELLAVAIAERKGSPDEVKTLLGYAAYQAKKSKNPNNLISVADLLYRRGIYEKVGPPGYLVSVAELIDLAAVAVPHRAEPLMMSINLATKTKDVARMGDAVDRLLSLGWPGMDQKIRIDARKQVDDLVKVLREDGRGDEADALLVRRDAAMARDLYIRLSWEGVDDIDIVVDEPLGATAQLYKNPRTVFGGAIVTNGFGKHPEEIYVCPRGFSGKYTVRVDKIFQPDKAPATVATLEVIVHEGTPQEKRTEYKIDLTKPQPVVIELENGRRKDVLPSIAPPIVVTPDPAKAKEKVKAPVAGAVRP